MRTRSAPLLLLAALLVSGCATLPTESRITIEELPSDRWRASYDLPSRVTSILFSREARGGTRAERWTIASPTGARWITKGAQEGIEFPAPVSHFTIELATDLEVRLKDYQIHIPFTDGSLLMYTGHFLLDEMPASFEFRSSLPVSAPGGEEAYVYFGSIPPVETERMSLIVDPGLPPWMARQLATRVPPIFDLYAKKMGTGLGFRPLVYVSYGGPRGSGISFKGGTVGRTVQIDVSGEGWTEESAGATAMWFGRIAHEIFHLYESERFHGSEDAEWLGEAASEYAALIASRESGVIDERGMHRLVVEAANECISGLGAGSLTSSISAGQFRNVYSCGLVSQWMAAHATGDAFTLLRKTYDREKDYTTADYLETLQSMTADSAPVEQLIHGSTPRADVFLEERLRATGIAVSGVPPAEATVAQNILRNLVTATVRQCACRTGAAAICEGGTRVDVDAISSRTQPERALAALDDAIDAGRSVQVAGVPLHCIAGDRSQYFEKMLKLSDALQP